MTPPRLHPIACRPILERSRWFAQLSAPHQAALLEHAVLQHLAAGERLFLRGQDNTGLYCVVEGSIRISPLQSSERESLLTVLTPPTWFGEIALFDDGPRTHDAWARTASTVLLVPRTTLLRLVADDPHWWQMLGRLLAEKVRALFSLQDAMQGAPALTRIAQRLLAMAQGYGMLAPGLLQRRVEVNQEQLGAMLDLTRQTVSEALRDLEQRGVVKRSYGAVELLDLTALTALAEWPPS